MEPELAVALPAAGWACTFAFRPRPKLALAAGAVFGVGGVAAIVLSTPDLTSSDLGVSLSLTAAARALLVAAAGALAFIVVLAPARAERSTMLRWGLAGLAGMAAIAVAPALDVAVVILLALVILQGAA